MEPVPEKTLLRWAESLAGVARTGLGFTESQYERERFEEVLKIAGDIKTAAEEGLDGVLDAWQANTGNKLWSYPGAGSVGSLAVAGSRVYFGAGDYVYSVGA